MDHLFSISTTIKKICSSADLKEIKNRPLQRTLNLCKEQTSVSDRSDFHAKKSAESSVTAQSTAVFSGMAHSAQ